MYLAMSNMASTYSQNNDYIRTVGMHAWVHDDKWQCALIGISDIVTYGGKLLLEQSKEYARVVGVV